jgi:glutathione S-transferase
VFTVYAAPASRSTRVLWTLEEIGQDYALVLVDLVHGGGRRPGFLALNPGGKVPVLVDGDLVLTESLAICTWLGDRFPESGIVPPPGTRERARHDQWCAFVVTELEQPLWTIARHRFVLPEPRRVPAVVDTARWEYERAAAVLDAGLGEREFLAADRFTVADVLAAHTLRWGRKAAPGVAGERLEAYADRMLARSALARVREREASGV